MLSTAPAPPSAFLPCPAAPDTRYVAHAGILEAARGTFLDIQEHGVLHTTLLAPGARCAGYQLVVSGGWAAAWQALPPPARSGWAANTHAPPPPNRPQVTGHSLGAGVAFLLALYLRQFFPNLR